MFVSFLFTSSPERPADLFVIQILRAVSQKVLTSPSINWREIAYATDGFSGADLQALVYNAHLEVVHASIAMNPIGENSSRDEDKQIEYTTLGGNTSGGVASKAEETALQRRVSRCPFLICGCDLTPPTPATTDKLSVAI